MLDVDNWFKFSLVNYSNGAWLARTQAVLGPGAEGATHRHHY